MTEAHWITPWLGTPWTPRSFECWHFASQVWRERFRFDVPALGVLPEDLRYGRRQLERDPERAHWVPVSEPQEGDCVMMAMGKRPCHVGIWIEPDGILHSVKGPGAIHTPAARIGTLGYRIIGLYRRCS